MFDNHQRQKLYHFFFRVFSYPDRDLPDFLGAEIPVVEELLSAEKSPPLPPLEALEVGYTALFVNRHGGVPAPPYGSVYLEDDGQLMGQTSLCALRAYEGEGLDHDNGGEPPDFMATELEFLYYLTSQKIDALSCGNSELAQSYHQRQADFFHTLLQPWLPLFCQRIQQAEGAEPFYCWSADMLRLFGAGEEALFGIG